MEKREAVAVESGRIRGLFYKGNPKSQKLLVLFSQWRSGAHSILSSYIARFVLESSTYGGVLFLDRIASGGASDNKLTLTEKKLMKKVGDMQFADTYAQAITDIVKQYELPKLLTVGGSSAGAASALAAGVGLARIAKNLEEVIMIEPTGIRRHGIKGRGAIPHALVKHLVAYRHRISRGWWTSMDKEQYFAKGKLLEYRAQYFASDALYWELVSVLADKNFPPLKIIMSRDSHTQNKSVRTSLKDVSVAPHRIIEVRGNHDRICQPPSLSKFYLNQY